jgi:hypothetical protein
MIGDVIDKADEFDKLPWNQLDPERCTKDWSFGRGGYGLKDEQWTISLYDKHDMSANIWVLPEPLSAVLSILKKSSSEEALRQFKNNLHAALGL